MKRLLPVFGVLSVLTASAFVPDAVRADELPTMNDFRQALDSMPALESPRSAAQSGSSCAVPVLSGARLQPKIFSLGWGLNDDLRSGGEPIGAISGNLTATSLVYRDAAGRVVAQALRSSEDDPTAVVLDCRGAKIGEIRETSSTPGGGMSFEIRDADGGALGVSGNLSGGTEDLRLYGPAGVLVQAISGDGYVLTLAPSFDSRLAVLFVALKKAYDLRRETREMERHHGGR